MIGKFWNSIVNKSQSNRNKDVFVPLDSVNLDLIGLLNSSISFNGSLTQIIDGGYATNADLFAIVSLIADLGSKIPIELVEVKRDGTEELITEGELYDLLENPNPEQVKQEFMEEALIYLLLSGNNYMYGKNILTQSYFDVLCNVPPQDVIIRTNHESYGNEILYFELGNIDFVEPDKIGHVKFANPTHHGIRSKYGLSPLSAGFLNLTASNELQQAYASVLKNKGISGIVTNDSDHMPFDAEEAKRLQEVWQQKTGGAKNLGKTMFTGARLRYLQMGMSPEDLKLIEGGVMKLRTMCNIFHVSSRIFNDPANTTFNNVGEATKSLYLRGVIPNVEKILLRLNGWFLRPWILKDSKNYKLRLNTSEVEALQEDKDKQASRETRLTASILRVIESVGNGKISRESGIKILVTGHNFTEDEATELIADTEFRQEETSGGSQEAQEDDQGQENN